MFNKRHIIYIFSVTVIILSLSAVGGATTSSDYDYERDAPNSTDHLDRIEVTLDVHTEGEVIEELEDSFSHPEITESTADEAYVEDGDIIASFDEPGTLTYNVTAGRVSKAPDYELNITAAGSLDAPDTVIEVNGNLLYQEPITLEDVRNAIDDWRRGNIGLSFVSEVIEVWQEGGSTD